MSNVGHEARVDFIVGYLQEGREGFFGEELPDADDHGRAHIAARMRRQLVSALVEDFQVIPDDANTAFDSALDKIYADRQAFRELEGEIFYDQS
jgi:hypothetical protein